MTVRKFDKLLRKNGWEIKSEKKHRKYIHPNKPNHICIPVHDKDVYEPMARRLLKEAGIR